jgi:hypothetical protein
MNKTREEIGRYWVSCRCGKEYLDRKLTAPDCPYHSTDVEEAMDEWAKQQGIAFGKWLSDWVVENRSRYKTDNRGCWYVTYDGVYFMDQLYKLFSQQKIK